MGGQDGVTMPEGLWVSSGMALTSDLTTIVQRIRLLGFNAIRLPFSMQDLFSAAPKYSAPATSLESGLLCLWR